eukprot:Seg1794.9 transcript_id=Seg1794.9/GoldUCD/mRNA.D3Y31 product="Centrosomal protein of 70 kDa" protein_id=Seg1794.9/GoldUCD/D3Y31
MDSQQSSVMTEGIQSTLRLGGIGQNDFSQMSDHPIEQADWLNVNNKLRRSGYDPVILSHPSKLNNTTSGYVILDEMVAHSLRNTIETLLDDCDRKQDLLQELVISSNKLQRDLDQERNFREEQKKEILSLKASLQTEKMKREEMERQRSLELENHSEEVQKLVTANSKLHGRCRELANGEKDLAGSSYHDISMPALDEKKATTKKPSRKSDILNEYNEKLVEMQEELEQLRLKVSKKESRPSKPTKKKSIGARFDENEDDEGEETFTENHSTQADSESTQTSGMDSLASSLSMGISDSGFLYKRLKTTEKKFKEAKKFIKELSEENSKLLVELKKRPKVKEWRKALVRNKQMENVLIQNNLSTHLDGSSTGAEQSIRKCNHVDDIDFFAIDVCREHLKDICKRIDVTNLNDVSRKLDTLEESFQTNYKMEKILRHLLRTVKSHERNVADDVSVCSSTISISDNCNETQWKCLVPTIKVWRDELKQLKNLSVEIAKLSDMLLPWKPKDLKHPNRTVPDSVTIETIKNQLHVLAEECKTGPIKHRRGAPGQDELRHVVEHFMKLFDVDDVTGTFARMNDIYVKNSEMSNVLRTLKDLLGLEKNANAANIVNGVGTLAKAKHLLHVQDLDTVIKRLDQYDEFYLAFKSVISSLVEILAVDSLDEIVPAVRALVRFP